jgi:NAD(P)-dependent dehydrogenase (short-subunit alcohol dehydrogenase family)
MLQDRVVVVTGAGRGLGAEYALAAARHGARVVVNDLGCAPDGSGSDPAVAEESAGRIRAAGGEAVANGADMATMDGARDVLDTALRAYGRVDAIVNNAGVLRDRMFVNMSEDEWDDVIRGQLRTTFCGSRVFAGHWRDLHKAGTEVRASLVNISSTSGLIGQVGQTNYGAAKAAVAALTLILADEVGRYGVRANVVVPVARTRMTEKAPGVADLVAPPADPEAFDRNHPAHVGPLVVWLLSRECPATKQVFYSRGDELRRMAGWSYPETATADGQWDPAGIGAAFPGAAPAGPASVHG